MSKSQKFDVIVVGLGAMGASTLYQLAKSGANVLGIDQYAPPHTLGSTHGESRISRLAVGEGPAYLPLVKRSHEIWRELQQTTSTPLFWETGGYLIEPSTGGAGYFGEGSFIDKITTIADANNLTYKRLTADQLQSRNPLLNIAPHSRGYYDPSGAVVSPERAIQLQLSEAKRHGADILPNTTVTEIKDETVFCGAEAYSADAIILATGAYAHRFLPSELVPKLAVYRQVMHWFETPDPAVFNTDNFPWIMWISEERNNYFGLFPTPTIPTATQGLKMMTEQFIETTDPSSIGREVTKSEVADMRRRFIDDRINVPLGKCIKSTVCLYTNTQDEHFIIDRHPDNKHVIIVSACSGHGFKHSAALGESIAHLAIGNPPPVSITHFRI